MTRYFRNGVVTVTNEPTLIVSIPYGVDGVIVQNLSAKGIVYIGGKNVAATGDSRGIRITPDNEPLAIASYEYEASDLYGIAADGDVEIAYLIST